MAESIKSELIAEGKALGLNLKKSMSVYELKARIKEAKENPPAPENKSKSKARGGEY